MSIQALWSEIETRIRALAPIPASEWTYFQSLATYRQIPKNSHFVRAGELADCVGICVDGLFRLYYTTPDGSEYNKSFCTRYEFVASYSALLNQTPAHFSIQALADSSIVVFPYAHFLTLYSRHPCWDRLGRVLVEQLYAKKEARERELLMLSAEARYRLFLEQYGTVAGQIPQYQIASYLGITPVALSRIRRRINPG